MRRLRASLFITDVVWHGEYPHDTDERVPHCGPWLLRCTPHSLLPHGGCMQCPDWTAPALPSGLLRRPGPDLPREAPGPEPRPQTSLRTRRERFYGLPHVPNTVSLVCACVCHWVCTGIRWGLWAWTALLGMEASQVGCWNAWSSGPQPSLTCAHCPPAGSVLSGSWGVRKAAGVWSVVFPIIFLWWENCWCEMTAMLTPQPLSLQRESTLVAGVRGAWFVLQRGEQAHRFLFTEDWGARCRPAAWPTAPDSDSSPRGMGWASTFGVHLRLVHVTYLVWEHVGVSDASGGTDPAQQPCVLISWVP